MEGTQHPARKSGTLFPQGWGWQTGQNRLTYRVKDKQDNIFYLSISARGKNPLCRMNQFKFEVKNGQYYLNGHLAREEDEIAD